ncbi:uncharacterized protein LOC120670830 isoform X1 [Panicum virgatum]|uniref:uncharacterized protein LOC120670830 isoform X1 n=1 Tax=Panicum virgatum TaxID=38727 RepID=UPI0019D512F7|nr:uncharacterized protein LOC120670830 isoform X1 [Panicum virgatum]XP_039806932.1 uncharacterized protein LOC120670830 isoform X1 [Panicum virgatum]
MLSLSRALGRRLFSSAAAVSESAAAASTSAVRKAQNPLEEFFEVERSTEEDKPRPYYGRSWKASELRLKSWDDLQKHWYVLMKEKNMLMTQRQMLHAENLHFPNPERISKLTWKALSTPCSVLVDAPWISSHHCEEINVPDKACLD